MKRKKNKMDLKTIIEKIRSDWWQIEMKHKLDLAVIFFSVFSLIFLVGYSRPLVIAPIENLRTTETQVLFSIEKASRLLIDDNIDFTTPEEYDVHDGMKLEMKPGKYYWKVVGITSSEIRTLIIESEINIELVEEDGGYAVKNAGNVGLFVDFYDGEEYLEGQVLEKGDKIEFFGNKIKAEQK